MTFWRMAASAALALLASGCGGSNGGSSGSGGVTLPPTSVTPTPTPSPTASPTYQSFTDPLASWEARGNFAFVEYVSKGRPSAANDVRIKMNSDIRSGIVEAHFTGRPTVSASFSDFMRGKFFALTDKDEINNLGDDGIVLFRFNADGGVAAIGIQYHDYQISSKEHYRFKYAAYPMVKYEFLNSGTTDQYTTLYYAFIMGDKTKIGDLPKHDVSRSVYPYAIFMSQVFAAPDDESFPYGTYGSLSFSPANGGFSGWLEYPNSGAPGSTRLDMTGSLDAGTNQISGTITSSNGLYSGTFQGSFYGPQGKEIGLYFTIRNKTGTYATAGTIRGVYIVCTNFVNGVVIDGMVCS